MPPVKDLTYQDIKTILAAAIGIREYNIDDVSGGFVYYTQDVNPGAGGSVRGTFKRSYVISDALEGARVTLGQPTQVVKRTIYEPLVVTGEFALEGEEITFNDDKSTVIRTGKIFQAGDYPDRDFSITEEELAQVPANFSPVDNDLEHKSTVLSGKLGKLESVVAKGKELFGTVAIPKWLNDQLGSDPLKVSLAWNKATKQIVGNALVLNPRIPDAELVAAFTAANSATTDVVVEKEVKSMTTKWFERLKGLFAEKKLPEEFADFNPDLVKFAEEPPKEPTTPAADAILKPDQSAEFSAVKAENDGLRARLIETEAERFFASALAEGKAFPAEKAALIAQFKQAVMDDNAGVACFSETGELKEGSRVKSLRDGIAARPAHRLSEELVTGVNEKGFIVLPTDAANFTGDAETPTPRDQDISPARRKRLAKMAGIAEEGK